MGVNFNNGDFFVGEREFLWAIQRNREQVRSIFMSKSTYMCAKMFSPSLLHFTSQKAQSNCRYGPQIGTFYKHLRIFMHILCPPATTSTPLCDDGYRGEDCAWLLHLRVRFSEVRRVPPAYSGPPRLARFAYGLWPLADRLQLLPGLDSQRANFLRDSPALFRPVTLEGSPTNRQFVCRGLTLAFAPRSIAKRRSADGNLSFMTLMRLSGSLAFLSSSSKTNK